ncbi:MAG: helical backbone metal receptor [Jatrophihabitans sp.]
MPSHPIVDDLGVATTLQRPPRTVVSLVPSLTEAIATSRPELLVAATEWCTHVGGLDLPRIRGTKNPDVRRITELKPDLVVCNQEENRELDVRRLRAAGVAVWVSRIRTLTEALDSMQRLFTQILDGELPDWLAQARELWAVPPTGAGPSVAVPIWRDPWLVVGSATFTTDLLARLGARNVFDGAAERYPRLSPAEILDAGPDLVLLPDEPYPFSAGDGPEAFGQQRTALVSGRLLTWYGPSLVRARTALESVVRL